MGITLNSVETIMDSLTAEVWSAFTPTQRSDIRNHAATLYYESPACFLRCPACAPPPPDQGYTDSPSGLAADGGPCPACYGVGYITCQRADELRGIYTCPACGGVEWIEDCGPHEGCSEYVPCQSIRCPLCTVDMSNDPVYAEEPADDAEQAADDGNNAQSFSQLLQQYADTFRF